MERTYLPEDLAIALRTLKHHCSTVSCMECPLSIKSDISDDIICGLEKYRPCCIEVQPIYKLSFSIPKEEA